MSIEQRANDIFNKGIRKVRVIYTDGRKATLRLFKHPSAGLCYYRRKSTRRGYELPFRHIGSIEPVTTRKTEEQKWVDGWKKVIARLQASGLWAHLIPDIEAALALGLPIIREANRAYWDLPYNEERDKGLQEFANKYPTLVKTNDEGKLYVDTSILWPHNRIPKVKKMRFCEGSHNETYLARIAQAMKEGKKQMEHGRASYDVSFEYNPEKKTAWYSEEYRNCGNGHYYLALDATHALFVEDD